MSDDDLAERFAAHVPSAFDEAYERYGALLRAAARHVLGSEADARDCVHDALLRVWSRAGAYRRERGGLRAFLTVCVRNEALTRLRSARRRASLEQRSAALERTGEVDPAERLAIRTALSALPPEQRDVLELAYWGQYTQSEIADKLAVPLGTIKSRAALGLRKLALVLGA